MPLLPAVSQCYMQDTVLGCTRASVSDYNEFDGHSMGYTKGYQQDQKSSDDWELRCGAQGEAKKIQVPGYLKSISTQAFQLVLEWCVIQRLKFEIDFFRKTSTQSIRDRKASTSSFLKASRSILTDSGVRFSMPMIRESPTLSSNNRQTRDRSTKKFTLQNHSAYIVSSPTRSLACQILTTSYSTTPSSPPSNYIEIEYTVPLHSRLH